MKVGIIGSGNWGKALATLVAEAGHMPQIGYRKKAPMGFQGSPNLAMVAKESDILFFATPPRELRTAVQEAKLGPLNHVVIAARGLDPVHHQVLSKCISEESAAIRVGALAGPALASEIFNRRPIAMVVGSPYNEVGRRTQKALHSAICRLYTSPDLLGVELAAATVLPLSIAIGLADGLRLGTGAKGVITTRGLRECTRLGVALQTNPHTFSGLAGMGDLVACGSLPNHPGFLAGQALAAQKTVDSSLISEIQPIVHLAKERGVSLPLITAILAMLNGEIKPRLAIDQLMRRSATTE